MRVTGSQYSCWMRRTMECPSTVNGSSVLCFGGRNFRDDSSGPTQPTTETRGRRSQYVSTRYLGSTTRTLPLRSRLVSSSHRGRGTKVELPSLGELQREWRVSWVRQSGAIETYVWNHGNLPSCKGYRPGTGLRSRNVILFPSSVGRFRLL